MFNPILAVNNLGRVSINAIGGLGHAGIFMLRGISGCICYPWGYTRFSDQLLFIGAKSVFVVALVGLFTGMVMSLQLYKTLVQFGAEGVLGAAVARSLILELAPVLASLVIAGRAGSAMAAELGIMRISEQIDALDTMDISPIKFLFTPRLLASILSFPLLTAIFNVVGIFGAYLIGVCLLGADNGIFWNSMISTIDMYDIICGLIKPLFFGFVTAWICCYRGYFCTTLRGGGQGAKAVGFATTSAVVISSVWILILDYILTSFMF